MNPAALLGRILVSERLDVKLVPLFRWTMDSKERAIRGLYDARARRDWDAVRALLADEVGWHEPGEEDHSGDYRGREEVVALFEKLVAVTEGTFQLEPEAFLNSVEHSAVLVRWWAEREGRRSEGNEIAVYRFRDNKIAEVWFYPDGYEPEAFSAVFRYH
jgi:ketosteroid isomerase-like protein